MRKRVLLAFLGAAVAGICALPAAPRLQAAGHDKIKSTSHVPLSSFVDSGQSLGGDVESSDVALGDLDAVVASYGCPRQSVSQPGW